MLLQMIPVAVWLFVSSAITIVGNFTQSCFDIMLLGGARGSRAMLNADCAAPVSGEPTRHNSTLDLNLCLGIDQQNGSLVWSIYGKYSNYCSLCSLTDSAFLTCSCKTLSGGVASNSTINLNDGVSNTDGKLACAGGTGS